MTAFFGRFEICEFTEDMLDEAEITENLCFSEPWSRRTLEYMFLKSNCRALACIEKQSGRLAAYAALAYAVDEGDIVNVATHPDYRRQGCARALLDELFIFACSQKLDMLYLEVRTSNAAAQSLYRSLGFEPIGIRKKYYSNPVEDAILMSKDLTQSV